MDLSYEGAIEETTPPLRGTPPREGNMTEAQLLALIPAAVLACKQDINQTD